MIHMPRRHLWSEAGSSERESGLILMESVPVHLWVLDHWLWLADEAVHFIERRLPTDERGRSAIDRLTPYWGNPICAAYLLGWTVWYDHRRRREIELEVRFDQLSAGTQAWLKENA